MKIINASRKKHTKTTKIKKLTKTRKVSNKTQYGGRFLTLAQNPSNNYVYYQDLHNLKRFYGYKPLQLNASMMQYLCDTKSLQFSTSRDKGLYMGFNNFPSIVETAENIEKKSKSVKNEEGTRDFTEVIEGNQPIIDRETNYNNLMNNPKAKAQFKIGLDKITYEAKKSITPSVIVEDVEYVKKFTPSVIVQDVEYVKKLIIDLPRILQDKSSKSLHNSLHRKEEICDLSYSTNDFLIIDRNKYPGIDDEVIIVGYPGEINPFLKLKVPDPKKKGEETLLIDLLKKSVFEDHKKPVSEPGNYCSLLINLYNTFKNKPSDKINLVDSNEYYKFMGTLINNNYKYIENLINLNPGLFEETSSDFSQFKIEIEERLREIIRNLFARPNTKIRYVFHPFIINKQKKRIEPLIYNVRELEPKHKPVLERILELIETKIPELFNIFNSQEKTNISQGHSVKYNNFYTYYRYGDIFHIKTQYL